MQNCRSALRGLQMDESEKARRIDTLTYQIGELERADLREGEEETLTARRTLLRNAGHLMEAVDEAWLALTGGEDSEGAVTLIEGAARALASAAGLSEEISQAADQLSELHFAADDAVERIRDLRDGFDFSPEALDEVESRLDVIYRLKKKYGNTVSDMLAYLEQCKVELDDIEFSADRAEKLEQELGQARADAKTAGMELSQQRKAAAECRCRVRRQGVAAGCGGKVPLPGAHANAPPGGACGQPVQASEGWSAKPFTRAARSATGCGGKVPLPGAHATVPARARYRGGLYNHLRSAQIRPQYRLRGAQQARVRAANECEGITCLWQVTRNGSDEAERSERSPPLA